MASPGEYFKRFQSQSGNGESNDARAAGGVSGEPTHVRKNELNQAEVRLCCKALKLRP